MKLKLKFCLRTFALLHKNEKKKQCQEEIFQIQVFLEKVLTDRKPSAKGSNSKSSDVKISATDVTGSNFVKSFF